MLKLKLKSKNKPAGDQPSAIKKLTSGLNDGLMHQTLLGVTGSGKTFTMANIIQNVNRPTELMNPKDIESRRIANEELSKIFYSGSKKVGKF